MVLLTELEDNNGCLTISALFASISNMIIILYEKQPKIDWFFFYLHENIVKIFLSIDIKENLSEEIGEVLR